MRTAITALLVALGILAVPEVARAIPRFAARNAMECIQCHINPSGGGARNEYGAEVFERKWLPFASDEPDETSWVRRLGASNEKPIQAESAPFSGQITETLRIGGDFRAAYIYIRPEKGVGGKDPNVTSSFFLMQADLYHVATLNDRLTLVIDVGVYSGFEAWGLWNLYSGNNDKVLLKVGRFVPAFGVREVEHQLYTREGIGLSATDRDTGLELTSMFGHWTGQIGLFNGTLGDTAFDAPGSERESFEKELVARTSYSFRLGPLQFQAGASFSFNANANQANPLFGSSLPADLTSNISEGVDELKAGLFLTGNLGRFTYLADSAYIQDQFTNKGLGEVEGHAIYQELSFTPVQGLDLVVTHEFKDTDESLKPNASQRLGFVAEIFPLPFSELRAMVRHEWGDTSPTGETWDAVLFLHAFM